MKNQEIIAFQNKSIRRIEHNGEWFFSVIDIVEILTGSNKPSQYWHNMKKRDNQLSPICLKLKLLGVDGKNYPSDCANTEGVLRIVMSVPSPKAEPLKLWLAEQGKRTLDETADPELGFERLTELYTTQGRSAEWIKNRLQSISTRKELTDEWHKRGVKEGQEYAILTATIAKGTFGVTPSEHGNIKGLAKQNLRDHMTPLELIFTALGEEATRQISIRDDAQGFPENHDTAHRGGSIAGSALQNFEEKFGEQVVSPTNFLKQITEGSSDNKNEAEK